MIFAYRICRRNEFVWSLLRVRLQIFYAMDLFSSGLVSDGARNENDDGADPFLIVA